ncbi:MAG: Ig-like domain-containing protein, partial [Gemmatimonadales bacterium]
MKTIPCLSRGFLALGLAACTSDGSTDSGTPPSSVRSISIAAPPLPLTIGTSVHLTAIALGNDGPVADTAAITWSGSNPQVVSVSSSGVVTAVGAGTATVTARDGTLADRATIDVTASPLAAIHLIAPSFQLHIGEAFQLIATATDLAGEPTMPPTVMWASSRPDVASVSSTGMLTVHAFGSTTVEAVAGLLHAVAPVVAGPVNA